MNAKDNALANINSARLEVDELPRSREASLVRTKLDEAALWLGQCEGSEVRFARSGDVLTCEMPLGIIRVELVDLSAADCSLRVEGCAPIDITVRRPHDRTLVQEATEVMAGLYLSRARGLTGQGAVVVVDV